MDALRTANGSVEVSLSNAELLVLHEALAFGEWSGEFDGISFGDALFVEILSRLQLALAPLIAELGSDAYGSAVDTALRQLRSPTP